VSGETARSESGWTVDTLKEYLERRCDELGRSVVSLRELLDERDRLYKERDDARRVAVDAALAAAKEQTATSFSASEKAIVKAENAQSEYNVRSNEFRGQLDDQAKRLISRVEVEQIVKSQEEKLQRLDTDLRDLRESRSEFRGGGQGRQSVKDESRANLAAIGTLLAIAGLVAGWFIGH